MIIYLRKTAEVPEITMNVEINNQVYGSISLDKSTYDDFRAKPELIFGSMSYGEKSPIEYKINYKEHFIGTIHTTGLSEQDIKNPEIKLIE